MDQIVVYPVIIKYAPDNTDSPYLVSIPDLDGMTQGKNIADSLAMAADYIGTFSLDTKTMPKSNYQLPKAGKDETVSLVRVNISKYRRENDERSIRKSVTIPNYVNERGKAAGINFSAVLTDAVKEKLGIK